ncbi:MAG: energy-coupling factor transporter transmembrane protein EcfT [Spirochaetia bacterium]|nr:energy-coupling factor transporter transmembrane protein EcfT [Spirochaetia bacterium]
MISSTYIAGRGFIYHIDARAKLLFVLLMCLEIFLPFSTIGMYLIVACCIAIAWYGTGLKQALSPLKTILPLIIIMILFTPFTYIDSSAVIVVKGLTIATYDGLFHLNLLIARFTAITYLTTLFVWTTSMSDIMLTFRFYGLSYNGALIITLAFRFIPFIADSFHMISDAFSLRTLKDVENQKRSRLFDILPTISCVLVFALKSIPNLAMSLEHRGLGRGNKRSKYHTIHAKGTLFTHLFICVMIATTFYLVFSY